jgi:hypothetical protein
MSAKHPAGDYCLSGRIVRLTGAEARALHGLQTKAAQAGRPLEPGPYVICWLDGTRARAILSLDQLESMLANQCALAIASISCVPEKD